MGGRFIRLHGPVAALVLCAACGGARGADAPAAASADAGPAPATLPASLPLRRDAASSGEPLPWGSPLALLALAGSAGAWLLWRRGGRGRVRAALRPEHAAVLRLSSQALTPQASVHAVQWNGEEFLLACTAQQVTLLSRRPVDTSAGEGA